MTEHTLWTDADKDAPSHLKNHVGEVALSECKVCGQGEGDLAPTCPGPSTAATPALDALTETIRQAASGWFYYDGPLTLAAYIADAVRTHQRASADLEAAPKIKGVGELEAPLRKLEEAMDKDEDLRFAVEAIRKGAAALERDKLLSAIKQQATMLDKRESSRMAIPAPWAVLTQLEAAVGSLDATDLLRTPAAQWRSKGEPDPHANHYDCERAGLMMGDLTDDALANMMFLYDHRTGLRSIMYLTAGKERIRWLSRRLEELREQHAATLEALEVSDSEGIEARITLRLILDDLPTRRDWLDPALERRAKAVVEARKP